MKLKKKKVSQELRYLFKGQNESARENFHLLVYFPAFDTIRISHVGRSPMTWAITAAPFLNLQERVTGSYTS